MIYRTHNLLLSVFVIFMVFFGCTQQIQSPENMPNISTNSSTVSSSATEWQTYNNLGISFDYPKDMNLKESLGSYYNGSGYATIVISKSEDNQYSVIEVFYLHAGSTVNSLNNPEEVASLMLSGDNKGKDPLGILDQATSKTDIKTFMSPNSYGVAEIEFEALDPEINKMANAYALEFYKTGSNATFAIRILSTDSNKAKAMRDKFVSSFK